MTIQEQLDMLTEKFDDHTHRLGELNRKIDDLHKLVGLVERDVSEMADNNFDGSRGFVFQIHRKLDQITAILGKP